jgi:hypothetical protein
MKKLHILSRGVLDAPIRVMHEAGRWLTGGDRLVQGVQRQARHQCPAQPTTLREYPSRRTTNMESGEAVFSNSDQSTWEPMAPDGIDRKLWEVACSGK